MGSTANSKRGQVKNISEYLHFTGPQPTGISRFPRRNVRTIYNVWIWRRQEHATSSKSQTSLIHCFNTQSLCFGDYLYSKTGRWAERQTGKETGRQAGRQAGRQTDRQADRQAGRQTDRQAEMQTARETSRGTGRRTGGQIGSSETDRHRQTS